MGLRLRVDLDELTWEQWDALEYAGEGDVSMARMRRIIAQFMVDEAGEPLPFARAFRELGELKRSEMWDAVGALARAVKEARESAVPPSTESG